MHYWIPLAKCFVFKQQNTFLWYWLWSSRQYLSICSFTGKQFHKLIMHNKYTNRVVPPRPLSLPMFYIYVLTSSTSHHLKKLVWEKPYWKCMDCCGYTDVVIPHKLAVVQFMDFLRVVKGMLGVTKQPCNTLPLHLVSHYSINSEFGPNTKSNSS